ncbi:hypothetical protein PMG11_09175 [Penicillium brasilianum]|uniref:Thioester reductase (TE) domain-containing protein n=1 Tax=Penicillium brasilianum TaxID=104259 RepID=A0A0F7TXF5_PENBI|nr:hypothetical protein PMG11_09175 [Penicillium brasilianum]
MTVDSVLGSGYGEAKIICETMLQKPLQQYPEYFRAMVVRIGQIAGSKKCGYWNPVEHFPFLIKSSVTLQSFRIFKVTSLGSQSVDEVATTLAELLLLTSSSLSSETTPTLAPYPPIYHIENPTRQPWLEMIRALASAALDSASTTPEIIPFNQWFQRVRTASSDIDNEYPAQEILKFFDDHFLRMACSSLIMDITYICSDSQTLAHAKAIDLSLMEKYVATWEQMGFLP